ncbi:MAG TPA: GtrA family protein [Spirochaetales bacterium]|nr:GtrA family protein [Spirochaetales bacterium]
MTLKKLFIGEHHGKRVQFSRAVIASFPSAAADYSLVAILMECTRIDILAAGSIGMLAGLAVTFSLGRRWVFPKVPGRQFHRELLFFALGAAAGALIHTGVLLALKDAVAAGLHYAFAKIAAVSAMFVWNFVSRRLSTRYLIRAAAKRQRAGA